jgi:hypothetical protein
MTTSERSDLTDVAAERAPTKTVPASGEAAVARRRRRRALGYVEAREVYLLKGSGMSASEIGRTYGVPHGSVLAIWRGDTYWWATKDLRAGS